MGLSGVNSNKDGYRNDLTERILKKNKMLSHIKYERDKFEREVNAIKNSKSYKLGKLLLKPFSFLKSNSKK